MRASISDVEARLLNRLEEIGELSWLDVPPEAQALLDGLVSKGYLERHQADGHPDGFYRIQGSTRVNLAQRSFAGSEAAVAAPT